MKIKYPELIGKCKTCLGCQRLEQEDFKGVYRCQYYIENKEVTNDTRRERSN